MAGTVRIGIVGCGRAATAHLGRLVALDGVEVVGCSDVNVEAARAMAASIAPSGSATIPAFPDHRELIRQAAPQAVAIFTPHLAHYRPALDALQAGCHAFVDNPLTTNAQEAADIVGLAKARGLKVGVGHQYRLLPSLIEARRRLLAGEIGPIRMVTATLSNAWLAVHSGPADNWRLDPRAAGGAGILADLGDHLVDALLWMTGRSAVAAAAFQARLEPGIDVVTAASVLLDDGTPGSISVSGVTSGTLFEIHLLGESGRLRATEAGLWVASGDAPTEPVELGPVTESIEGNFVSAVASGSPLCCPADEALGSVRLLEAIVRSAATSQVVRLA